MNAATIVAILGVIGGGAGITTLLTLLPTIKRLKADTGKVEAETGHVGISGAAELSTAALAQMNAALARATSAEQRAAHAEQVVETLRRDAATIHDDCRERLSSMEHELERYRAVAQDHVAWDMECITRLTNMGVNPEDIPDAPPLLPRRGAQHHREGER